VQDIQLLLAKPRHRQRLTERRSSGYSFPS
jgi:hypothetical protein